IIRYFIKSTQDINALISNLQDKIINFIQNMVLHLSLRPSFNHCTLISLHIGLYIQKHKANIHYVMYHDYHCSTDRANFGTITTIFVLSRCLAVPNHTNAQLYINKKRFGSDRAIQVSTTKLIKSSLLSKNLQASTGSYSVMFFYLHEYKCHPPGFSCLHFQVGAYITGILLFTTSYLYP
ncbi:hypothetical protein BDA99DRAFT_520849, partial [Phascolomyces articulosus]